MSDEWFGLVIPRDIDRNKPGLYEWTIQGVGSYIGTFTHISRPLHEYTRNVERLLAELPYRPRKPNGFRDIHRALAEARRNESRITLTILGNVDPELINERELMLIDDRGTLNRTGRHKARKST